MKRRIYRLETPSGKGVFHSNAASKYQRETGYNCFWPPEPYQDGPIPSRVPTRFSRVGRADATSGFC